MIEQPLAHEVKPGPPTQKKSVLARTAWFTLLGAATGAVWGVLQHGAGLEALRNAGVLALAFGIGGLLSAVASCRT